MAVNIGSAVAYLELDTSKFSKGFLSAKQDLKTFGDSTKTTEQRAIALQGAFKTVGSTLTKSVTLSIVGVGAAAVKVGADFESAMSQVAATMGKPKAEIQELSDFAKEMGRTTAFSASEAAEGLNILAMSGLSASEQIATLPTVLDLASAGNIELADSATYVTGAVKGFGDSMDNATKYSDLMAKGATLANTNIAQLGEALSGSSATAKNYGQSADSVTLSLLRLAEQNVTGAEATTALNRAMMDLYTPTSSAKKALDELGISAYDAQGNARDFNDVVDELNGALSGMSEEERNATANTIFTTYGLQAFNKMTATSTEKVNEFKKGLAEAGGSAAKQAQEQLNNLKGDLKLFVSALEGAGIAISETLLPMLRGLVQGLTNLVTKFNELSPEMQDKIVKFALLAASIGPVLLIVSKMIGTFVELKTNLSLLGSGLKLVGTAIGGISAPILAIVAVIGVLVAAFVHLWNTNEEFEMNISRIWIQIKNTIAEFVDGIRERFSEIGITFNDVINVVKTAWEGLCSILAPVFEGAFKTIFIVIDSFLTIITGFIDIVRGIMTGDWVTIWEGVKEVVSGAKDLIVGILDALITTIINFFVALVQNVFQLLSKIVQHIISWGTNIVNSGKQAMTNFVNAVKSVIDSLPDKIKSVINKIPQIITNLGTTLYSAGRNAFQRLLDGIMSIANSIISFVQGLASKISSAVSGIGGKIAGVINGSHAGGLDYVPFDGYIAELHEGERVLTKQEAKAYNEGRGASSGGDVFNFYNTKPTPYEYARQMKRAKKELAYNF